MATYQGVLKCCNLGNTLESQTRLAIAVLVLLLVLLVLLVLVVVVVVVGGVVVGGGGVVVVDAAASAAFTISRSGITIGTEDFFRSR